MKKDPLSFADVEQLLTELARHDLQQAQDEAQTALMRGAACGEIRRVFRRRRIRRIVGEVAAVAALGSTLYFMKPEEAAAPPLAKAVPAPLHTSASAATAVTSAPHLKEALKPAATPPISYESRSEGCELVIYSVPL